MTVKTTRPRRFLLASWEGGGNVPPAMTAARALAQRGHEVLVLCEDATAADVRAAGARPAPWRRAPNRPDRTPNTDFLRDWEAEGPESFALLRDRLLVGPAEAYARDVMEALEAFDADVVVPSDLLFGAILGAEASGKPIALLAANLSLFPIPGLPPFGPGFFPAVDAAERARDKQVEGQVRAMLDVALPRFNGVRRRLGLQPIATMFDLADAADRVLLATSQAFDYPLKRLPEPFRYIGPLLDAPTWIPQHDEAESAEVLVALSTTYQQQAQTIRNVIAALEGVPLRAVVTLGPSLDAADFEAPDTVRLVPGADHDRLMAGAKLVITHAGHGTVMRALRHGRPLLCLPMGRDQNDNAARVAYHGAGLRLAPTAEPAEIRSALQQIIGNPQFASRAEALQQSIIAEDSEQRLILELEGLAEERLPPVPTCARAVDHAMAGAGRV